MGFSTEDAQALRVTPGFQLADVDPGSTPGFNGDDDDLDDEFEQHDDELNDLQENLWANAQRNPDSARSVLIVLQGMDTSGKGGMIERLMRPFNPLGTSISAFGKPTEEELEHDFLWRIRPHLPKPGQVAVFDRSHYEDVLIQRVEHMVTLDEIERRYKAIKTFEQEIADSGTVIIKVMLHISREFQYENLLERLTDPEKMWKYDPSDLDARRQWSQYMAAYQIALERTSTEDAPWYCVPSDNKDYARTAVKHLLVDTLRELKQPWPPLREGLDAEAEIEKLKLS